MRIVGVTGGAGFIGSHVVDNLIAKGYEVVILDHHGRWELAEREQAAVLLGDVRDETAVFELAAHCDGIIHLASVLGTQETVANPRPAVLTNIAGALNVFEACVRYGLPVVNICVGNAGMANPYSASKTCVESLAHMYREDRGLRINQVRAVNAYGARQAMAAPYGAAKVRKIMPAFIARALTGAPIEVYGDGSQVSDMVAVEDVADVLVWALERAADHLPGSSVGVLSDVLGVGPTDHLTVQTIAHLVAAEAVYLGYGIKPVDVVNVPMRPGETPGAVVSVDPEPLEHAGYDRSRFRPLESNIRDVVAWYADNWLPTYEAQAAVTGDDFDGSADE